MIVSRRSRIILPPEPAEAEDGEWMRRDYSLVHEQPRLRAQMQLAEAGCHKLAEERR
jgi:hypothetical protein